MNIGPQHQTKRRFGILDIRATDSAFRLLSPFAIVSSIDRHHDGDWGEVTDAERAANEAGILNLGPIKSRFRERDRVFTIHTSGDRQTTIIALVNDPDLPKNA